MAEQPAQTVTHGVLMTHACTQPAPERRHVASTPGDLPPAELVARQGDLAAAFRHDNTIAPTAPDPATPVEVTATCGSELCLLAADLYYTTDGSDPQPAMAGLTGSSTQRLPMRVAQVEWQPLAGYLTWWQAIVPPQPAGTLVRYRIGGYRHRPVPADDVLPDIWAHEGQGHWYRHRGTDGITSFAYLVESSRAIIPAWLAPGVIYHIFLDRFHPGTAYGAFPPGLGPHVRHGGTLQGVRSALDYLADLGVTCLWLSPLCQAETYHRYDATDLAAVDPDLGSEEDLRDLVATAHARGMQVVLDFVANHCSWHHPAFEAAQRDAQSPTASWFVFDQWPHRFRSFLGTVTDLPEFNLTNVAAREYVIGSALQWLERCGVDGFRLDHASGPSLEFWTAFRRATHLQAPDSFTMGEVSDTPDALRRYRGRFDAVLDFPLARALRLTFGTDEWSLARLDGYLVAHDRYMTDGPSSVSFLDNHDMNRFLFLAGNDVRRLKLAALCQFTLAAIPTIYYGTEVGMSQEEDMHAIAWGGDAQARGDMIWDQGAWNEELLAFYRTLIRLRRSEPILQSGLRCTLHLDEGASTYVYARGTTQRQEHEVLVALNRSGERRTITLPKDAAATASMLLVTEAATNVRVTAGALSIQLTPYAGAIVRLV